MSAREETAEHERLLERWNGEPRFHALVRQFERAAARGSALEVLEALRMADEIFPVDGSAAPAHLDRALAEDVLEWCKREGGLDLYGWGDLISRLQDCVVPMPLDAPAKVSEAYRQGWADAVKHLRNGGVA